MKKFAVFDIDGTLFRWQLYHELFDALADRGVIAPDDAAHVRALRDEWRARETPFATYEIALVEIFERSIVGMREHVLIEAADHIIAEKGRNTYSYTRTLLASLKRQGYTIVAISGSQQQIVERFAALYGIDIVYGKRHHVVDGVIVDKTTHVYGRKADILNDIVVQHRLTWDDSYAVGDTLSDAAMLELVEHPIAFNPDKPLYDHARANHWKIVVERKNVTYELSHDGTSYILA